MIYSAGYVEWVQRVSSYMYLAGSEAGTYAEDYTMVKTTLAIHGS